jgi:hypothetical protein
VPERHSDAAALPTDSDASGFHSQHSHTDLSATSATSSSEHLSPSQALPSGTAVDANHLLLKDDILPTDSSINHTDVHAAPLSASPETSAASTDGSASLPVSPSTPAPKRKRGRPTTVPEGITPKKITYYLKNPALEKQLKRLSVETERDLSDLTTEALEDLLKKYGFLQ